MTTTCDLQAKWPRLPVVPCPHALARPMLPSLLKYVIVGHWSILNATSTCSPEGIQPRVLAAVAAPPFRTALVLTEARFAPEGEHAESERVLLPKAPQGTSTTRGVSLDLGLRYRSRVPAHATHSGPSRSWPTGESCLLIDQPFRPSGWSPGVPEPTLQRDPQHRQSRTGIPAQRGSAGAWRQTPARWCRGSPL